MYRGRLVWPFLAEIKQLDTAATEAGPPTPGYDGDFREPVRVPDSSPRGSHSARVEKVSVFVPCQVDSPQENQQQQSSGGDVPSAQFVLVFHFVDLARLGLVDGSTGEAAFRVNDRLVAVTRMNGDKVREFPDPPGMYATQVKESGWGLHGLFRNLLLVTFQPRGQGIART